MFFFSYVLLQAGRIKRIGKGKVTKGTKEAIESYLKSAYPSPEWRWDTFRYELHASESAAFKEERRLSDAYERKMGKLPPWNQMRGGTGGAVFKRCKARLANRDICLNSAIRGYGGYCGVHRLIRLDGVGGA